MAYVYRDRYGIRHAVVDEKVAEKNAVGPVKEVDIPTAGGYPAATIEIVDYGDGEVYIGGNKRVGLPLAQAPASIADAVMAVLHKVGPRPAVEG